MIFPVKSAFTKFLEECPPDDATLLKYFFIDVNQHCSMSKYNCRKIVKDFENAILYLVNQGTTVKDIIERLSPSNLGNFYSRHNTTWFKLDNAAKIYPISMNHGKMVMFRLSANLKEMVVPEILQMALTFTIKRFPSFATDVKKGFFWHYLNSSQKRYSVTEETETPCRPMSVSGSGSPAFRLIYYKNRISVEFFHILTDGTGGMIFLKTLIAEYLRLMGIKLKTKDDSILDINEPPLKEETDNAFEVIEKTSKSGGFSGEIAAQMSGRLSKIRPCQILHFKINQKSLKEVAAAKGGTVTAYILSKMFLAGLVSTEKLDGNFTIQLPVNLRKFYPHKTLLNFSLYSNVTLRIPQIKDDEELVKSITAQVKTKSDRQPMAEMANATNKMVKRLAPIPLFIKLSGVKVFYHFLADAVFTTILSSLGVVTLPEELASYVESMDATLGNGSIHRTSCTLLTYGETATFTISKNTTDPSFEERIYELLKADGLEVKVERSPVYGK